MDSDFNFNDYVEVSADSPIAPGRRGVIVECWPHQKDGVLCWLIEPEEPPFADLHVPVEHVVLLDKNEPSMKRWGR